MFVCRERQNQSKANRRLEKKAKEYAVQVEEERARADQFKNEVCCYSARCVNYVLFTCAVGTS